ncbi:transcription initiation factor IIF, beta subunit-domain-containing protein [Mycena floridula]|nr:transcription initiation factor IIF, beta subunit-domain-containing protein [Mycena floridula]
MDDPAREDEKKPFDAEVGPDDDSQPDPDEQLMLDQGNGRVWLVKIPKSLMERWAAVNHEDVHLATIRVYNNPAYKKPRIILFLPPHREQGVPQVSKPDRPVFDGVTLPTTKLEPDWYQLDMVNDTVENQIVVAERPKDASFNLSGSANVTNNRARTTILTGRIKHDCMLRSVLSDKYRQQMRERTRKANTPLRQIKMIEDAGIAGGRGGINILSSGVAMGANAAFGDLVKTKPKPAKGQFERMARMPRNQLLDLIFQLFRERSRWSLKPLRERTQQPEAYLKEVLSEVAHLYRSGEFNGLWELKENFKEEGMKAENVPGPSFAEYTNDVKMETMDDDDDDDEDDDMEEVS